MKFKIFVALLLFCGPLLALAETPGAERSESATKAPKLLFRTLGVGVNESEIFYVDKDKAKPCSIDSERRSQYFEYSALPAPIDFVRLVRTPDGEEQRIAIAQAKIDPSLRRALLIFTHANQSIEKLQVMVLKEDAAAIPPGGYRVLNFLPTTTEVAAGINKQTVSPGGVAVLTPQPASQMNVYAFKVFGINPKSNAQVTLYSNVYAPDKNVRYLVLILPSPTSPNQMDVKLLEESVNAIRPDDPEPQPATR